MREHPLLFLDFDGVICDSLAECMVSAFYAYFRLYKKKEPASLSLDYKEKFFRLRPYVRDGEDYLVIQHILEQDISINNQQQFDEILTTHKDKMALYKELFYEARTLIIRDDPDFWFHLNRIYPHLLTPFAQASTSPDVFILSTKRADFILSILNNNNIRFREDQVHVAWGIKKLDLIASILDKKSCSYAVFVDDQISHLVGNTDPRITPYLASWGYIQEEWRHQGVNVMEEEGIRELLKTY
ncbi:MAG: HAD family hydrolase [Spirochaetales bacterium]|nr:HAD family hydrolase [Spirochaetales bacterium]